MNGGELDRHLRAIAQEVPGTVHDPIIPLAKMSPGDGSIQAQIEGHDPWAHRYVNMACRTCMWFVPKATTAIAPAPQLGRCRRHAPTMSGYPAVFETDWCGDHKLDENRRW